MAKGAYIGVSELEIYVDAVMSFAGGVWEVSDKDDLPLVSGEELLVHVNVNGTVYRNVILEENLFGMWFGTPAGGEITLRVSTEGYLDFIDNNGTLDESLSYPIKIYSETENIARKIKKGYIGVPNMMIYVEATLSNDGELLWGGDASEFNLNSSTSYTFNVDFNGTVYPNVKFIYDEGAWYGEIELGTIVVYFYNYIEFYDDTGALDTSKTYPIRLYTGSPDGVARKIKKAYIGVDGVARLCWSDGESDEV